MDRMRQSYQEWLESSHIDKNHHLPYLETRPPLKQPKRALSSEADISHSSLIMILLAFYPFTLFLWSPPSPSPCPIKPLDFLLLRKELCALLSSGSSENGEGNCLDHKRKERFQFNSLNLKPR